MTPHGSLPAVDIHKDRKILYTRDPHAYPSPKNEKLESMRNELNPFIKHDLLKKGDDLTKTDLNSNSNSTPKSSSDILKNNDLSPRTTFPWQEASQNTRQKYHQWQQNFSSENRVFDSKRSIKTQEVVNGGRTESEFGFNSHVYECDEDDGLVENYDFFFRFDFQF